MKNGELETFPEGVPAASEALHAIGHLARAVERRFPGVIDDWVDSLENEALLNEIIRLRGPREADSVRRVRSRTLTWAKHVRLVTLAHFATEAAPPGRRP